jgi:hypothetical protein
VEREKRAEGLEYMHPKPSSHSGRIVGNPKVGPQALSSGVDRVQWRLEPMRNHSENCLEL